MKKQRVYLFVSFFIFCFVQITFAQEKKQLWGFVANSFTKEQLIKSKVELLLPDSTVIDTTTADGYFNGKHKAFFIFYLNKNREEGNYIIRCLSEGYETSCKNIQVKFHKRENYIELGTFYLKKKSKETELNEVIVKATKVKFYMNGDTVVYNADAFQLSEGSMLDALISQLPGVELKDDGRILVNGKFVSSLLLNGKDFFKGDNKIMLDNLPSYMVKNVKVYEKEGELSKFMGRDMDDKEFVMDVNLKREYSIGWIANLEVGTGSEDRYLSRFFGLRFTPHSRISFFGNMNNLNENRTPGKTGDWTPANMSDGLLATKMGGIDYETEAADEHYSLSGNARITHSDTDNKTTNTSTNFLTGGDTYGRSQDISNSRNTNFTTDHTLSLQGKVIYFSVSPHLDYQKYNNQFSGLSGTFSEDPSNYISSGLLDSLSSPNAGSLLRRIAINRNKQNYLGEGHRLNTNINMSSFIKLEHSSDLVRFYSSISYSDAKNEAFQHYQLDYLSNTSSSTDYRNQYNHTPEYGYNYNLRTEYWYNLSNHIRITPYYQYSQAYNSNERLLYRLDRLNGWDENSTEQELGALPSTTDSLQKALDRANSYYSSQHDFVHRTGVNFHYEERKESGTLFILNLGLPIRFEKNALSYQRAALDTAFCHRVAFFDPSIHIECTNRSKHKSFIFNYNCNSSAPLMTYLLNIRDDSNPLYITLGNANLKNTHTHDFSFSCSNQLKGQKLIGINLAYSITQNAIAMGYVYNKTTGVRTTTPDNVNGNWNSSVDVNFSSPLDKAKHLTFSTYSRASFYKSVDLVSVSGASPSSRSTVGSLYLTENIRTDYQISNKAKIGAKIKGVWTRATSTREDFSTINSVDFNYGLTGQIELPWKMQLSTDLTEYSRRGYEDNSMNTNELVWNARLSKRVLHNNLTFMVDGFDILGNLSNVRRTINAQGRTESYYNVIPSYVMLHAIYRLNIQPKNKK